LAKCDGFGEALDQPGDADLVDHLGELAGAGGAHQLAHAGKARDHRLDPGIGLRCAAAHHGQHAVLGAGLAAGDRGVDEAETGSRCRRVELARDIGRGGGVVDEDGALAHCGEGAVLGRRHRAQIVVIADASEHDLLALGGLGRRRSIDAAMLCHPFLRLLRRAIVDRDVMALGLEMAGHGIAHHAETEESDFGHEVLRCNRPKGHCGFSAPGRAREAMQTR
jgi:hypothetical protein